MTRLSVIFLTLGLIGSALARYKQTIKTHEEPLVTQGREITQNLYIDNPYHDAGKWGIIDLCQEGSFASAFELKYNPPGHVDETAVNAIKLYCTNSEGHDTGYVSSSQGIHGDWYGMKICSFDFITGFRANVLKYQGIFVDDVAVEDVEVDCNYGREIIDGLRDPVSAGKPNPFNFKTGVWSSYATCRDGLAVCGIQTRYEDSSLGDETAIADIVLFCCDRNGI